MIQIAPPTMMVSNSAENTINCRSSRFCLRPLCRKKRKCTNICARAKALVTGLFVWFALLWFLVRPRALTDRVAQPIVRMFMVSRLCRSPCFTVWRCSLARKTSITVVGTWRFWIIHLWVEGFFEFFATTVVVLTFYQLGLTRRKVTLRVIDLDAILTSSAG